jgi:hypothetical protein
MREPPTNRNVPQWMWDNAVRDYDFYKARYDKLRARGLSDAEADRYIDLVDRLDRHTESVNDSQNPDFFHDDLATAFEQAAETLAEMRRLWEKLT